MSDKLDAQISMTADATGVETGVGRAKRSLKSLGEAARQAGADMGGMGAGSDSSVKQVGRNTKTMEQQLQRYMAVLQAGGKDSRKYWEQMADFRGVDKNALRPLLDQLDQLKEKQEAAARGAASLSSSLQTIKGVASAVLGSMFVSEVAQASSALYEASAAAERLRIGLDFASSRGHANELAYLRKTTHDLGLAFGSTATAYMQFQAAARGTSMEGDKARAVFESIAKASAVMGLSADQSSGALLAMQQMVSKGTVQAEELRGQLGERLPGAFQIAARAMGVTTAELGKMLEQGEVISEDFLPKFAKELEDSLGGAAEKAANRLDAAVNRFDAAWERMKQNVGDSGVSNYMAQSFGTAAGALDAISVAMEQARFNGAGFWGQMGAATGVMHDLTTSTGRATVNMYDNAVATAEAQKELERLQRIAATQGTSAWLLKEIGNVQRYIGELQQARREKEALQGGALVGAYTEGMGNSKTIVQQRAKFEAAEKGYYEIIAKRDGVTKDFIGTLGSLEKALAEGVINESAYVAEVTKANQARYESSEAGKAEAKALKAGAGEAKAAENSYQGLLKAVNEHMAAVKLQMDGSAKLTESQKLQIKYDELLARGKQGASAATIALVQAQIAALAILEKEQKAIKLNVASYQEYLALQDELADDYVKQAKAKENLRLASDRADLELQDQIARIELEAQMLGRTAEARQIAMAQLDAEIDRRKELEALAKNLDLDESVREEERIRIHERYAKKVALAQRKAYVSVWDKTSQLIGDTLADYIMSGGKDAATYLKRLFSTLVLQPVVNWGVQGALQMMGMGGASTGGASSALGSINNVQSIASFASNAQSYFTVAKQFFAGSMSAGNAAGTLYANATGAGLDGLLASNGAYGTSGSAGGMGGMASAWPLAVVAGMIASNKLFDAGYSAKNFDGGQKVIGAVKALETNILSKLVGEKTANILTGAPVMSYTLGLLGIGGVTPHAGAASEYINGTASGNAATAQNLVNAGDSYIESMQTTVDGLATSVGSTLDALATAFGKQSGYYVGTGFTSDGKDASSGFFQLTTPDGDNVDHWTISRKDPKYTSRGEEGYAKDAAKGYDQYLKDVAEASLKGVLDLVPDWADDMVTSVQSSLSGLSGADAMQAFQTVVQQIAQVKAAFESLGQLMPMFSDLTGSVQSTLIKVSGGFDALSSNAQIFYGNFYSEQEKLDAIVRDLTETFGKYGAELPTTAEQYRELVEQQIAAGDAGAEFAAVLLGLNGTFKSVADVWKQELDGMAVSVTGFFADVQASIEALSADVAGSRKDILRGTGVMTEAEIRAAIGDAMVYAPSTAGVVSAQGAAASAAVEYSSAASRLTAVQAASDAEQQRILENLGKAQSPGTLKLGQSSDDLWESILSSAWDRHLAKYGVGWNKGDPGSNTTDAERAALLRALNAAYVSELDARIKADAAARKQLDVANMSGAQSDADAAKKALDAAQQAELQAKIDYAAQIQQLVVDAGNSVGKLSDLRGEVVSFYEAQAQAVQGMLQSAGNLRTVVDQVRIGQLDSAQTAAELGNRYAVDYAMALATTGSTRAGYVDAMAGNLQGLSEALKAEAVTGADWRIETAKLFAQASNAAVLLEGDAEADEYKDVALGLLDSIDAALEGLGATTASAEQVIADAISAGTEAQLGGLRAIVAALKGDPIPAFATGGFHAGGLRLVGEHGPELEATGPSRIWNQSQLASALGGGGNTARLEALVGQLIEENRAQASAIVRLQQDNNRLLMRWETRGLPTERDEV